MAGARVGTVGSGTTSEDAERRAYAMFSLRRVTAHCRDTSTGSGDKKRAKHQAAYPRTERILCRPVALSLMVMECAYGPTPERRTGPVCPSCPASLRKASSVRHPPSALGDCPVVRTSRACGSRALTAKP